MVIYVMRHGQTDWNVAKRLQGRSDTVLNENGRELARKTGEALLAVPFAAAFCCPLKRAKETAALVLGGREIPVFEDERLIEISFGVYEGLCSAKDHYEIPDREFSYFFTAPNKYRVPEGGESFEELHRRTADFLRDITARQELEDKTVLVSTHGAAGRALLNALRIFEQKDFWNGGVSPNCSISILESVQGNVRLIEENKIFYSRGPIAGV